MPMPPETDWHRRLELLVIQPTPFCNLDCRYCYLPDRNNTERMELKVLQKAIYNIFKLQLPNRKTSIVWHAGEPLVVPIHWYRKAFEIIAAHNIHNIGINHHFQSNAVLLDDSWCQFIHEHLIKIGISLDGPQHLHDKNRMHRSGKGSFTQAMAGVKHLQNASIPFHAICVLSKKSLQHPDEIYDFFLDLGVTSLCFNMEEIEGSHRHSSLQHAGSIQLFHSFFSRIVKRSMEDNHKIRIREIDNVIAALKSPIFGNLFANSQNQAGRIITVNYLGQFSTWSPELISIQHPEYGSLIIGDATNKATLIKPFEKFKQIEKEINAGVNSCHKNCSYFNFCLGGAPSNKLSEHNHFDTSETLHCTIMQKTIIDIVLTALDNLLPAQNSATLHREY